MTPTERKIEKYAREVGENTSYEFKKEVEVLTEDLMLSLDDTDRGLISDETKIDYVTLVFASVIDSLIDRLKKPDNLN